METKPVYDYTLVDNIRLLEQKYEQHMVRVSNRVDFGLGIGLVKVGSATLNSL